MLGQRCGEHRPAQADVLPALQAGPARPVWTRLEGRADWASLENIGAMYRLLEPPGPDRRSVGPVPVLWRTAWPVLARCSGAGPGPVPGACAARLARVCRHLKQVSRFSARAIRIPFVRRFDIEVQAGLHPLAGPSQFFFPAHPHPRLGSTKVFETANPPC